MSGEPQQTCKKRKENIIQFFMEGQFDEIYTNFSSFPNKFDTTTFVDFYNEKLDNPELMSKGNQIFSNLLQEAVIHPTDAKQFLKSYRNKSYG
jgi:hypothetical protein